MKVLALHAVGDLRLEDRAEGVPGPGQVRVRIAACGVCGSDLPRCFVKGTYRFPTVPGHEFAGVVDVVGPDVGRVSPGDAVAVFPLLWCGRCEACAEMAFAQCLDYDYLGSRSDGAFAQSVIAPEANLLKVPKGVSLDDAALTEPASVALHAIRRAGGTKPGESVAIFGAGPIGLMSAWWASHLGASQVLLFDVDPRKLALARSWGFEDVHDARFVKPEDVVAQATGTGAHVTLEAAGVPATTLAAIGCTRRAGRCVIMGNPEAGVHLPPELVSQAMRREITIHGTWNSRYEPDGLTDDWHMVLQAMAGSGFHPSSLVSHRVALDQAADFLLAMFRREVAYDKVLIIPPPTP